MNLPTIIDADRGTPFAIVYFDPIHDVGNQRADRGLIASFPLSHDNGVADA